MTRRNGRPVRLLCPRLLSWKTSQNWKRGLRARAARRVITVTNWRELIEQINASGYGLTLFGRTYPRLMKPLRKSPVPPMSATCTLTVIWWARSSWRPAVWRRRTVRHRQKREDRSILTACWHTARPMRSQYDALTRQDARYPVDAQLKTTLLAPLTALTQWASIVRRADAA